jgi:hypothetical protein
MKRTKRTERQLSGKAIGSAVHALIRKSLILTFAFGIVALAPVCRAQSESPVSTQLLAKNPVLTQPLR